MIKKCFKFPLFPGKLGYVQCDFMHGDDVLAVAKEMGLISYGPREASCSNYDANDAEGVCYKFGHHSLIFLSKSDNKAGVVVHECIHAANNLLDAVGVKDEEVLAYLTQWAFESIYKYWVKI